MPKVSVIIPVYGVEKYIERCARTLFEQTLDDIEYLFIDDCSPDKSIEILKEVLKDYPNRQKQTKIMRMSTNSGLPAVRRHGIIQSTGNYIIHCDSDDWVDKTMFQKMWLKAIDSNADIVLCDYYEGTEDNYIIKKSYRCEFPQSIEIYFKDLLSAHVSTSVWNRLVKAELYKHKDFLFPSVNMWEDYVINIQLANLANKISYVEEPLYFYFYNPQSISHSNYKTMTSSLLKNAQKILDFVERNYDVKKLKNEINAFKYYCRFLVPVHTKDKKCFQYWQSIFPEIDKHILFNHRITINDKLRFLTIHLRIYPIVFKYKNRKKLKTNDPID